jgi:hypothetical protein
VCHDHSLGNMIAVLACSLSPSLILIFAIFVLSLSLSLSPLGVAWLCVSCVLMWVCMYTHRLILCLSSSSLENPGSIELCNNHFVYS